MSYRFLVPALALVAAACSSSPSTPASPRPSTASTTAAASSATPAATNGLASLEVTIDGSPVTVKNSFYDRDAAIAKPARPLMFGVDVVSVLNVPTGVFQLGADQWGVQVNLNQKAIAPHVTFDNVVKVQILVQHGTGAGSAQYNGLFLTPVAAAPNKGEAQLEVSNQGNTDDLHLVSTVGDLSKQHPDIKLELTAKGLPTAQ